MGLLFEGAVATNGLNSLGHYTRLEPLDSSCTDYVSSAIPGCSANFSGAPARPRSSRRTDAGGPLPSARTAIVAAAVKSASGADWGDRGRGRPAAVADEGNAMKRGRREPGLMGNPILIGALTVLVTIVAVTLAYNATNGLPFVPTYSLHIQARTPRS